MLLNNGAPQPECESTQGVPGYQRTLTMPTKMRGIIGEVEIREQNDGVFAYVQIASGNVYKAGAPKGSRFKSTL